MMQNTTQKERERVYSYLVEQIINGEYRVGDMLNERRIGKQLSVSRTPVREAIHRLEAEGWVMVIPWKGIFIQGISQKQVIEIFQIRSSLEHLSISLMLERNIRQQWVRLEEIVLNQEKLIEKSDPKEFIRLDREFHNTIANFSGNGLLVEMLQKLEDRLLRLGLQSVQNSERYQETICEHKKILEALQQGKAEAVQAMDLHLEATKENLFRQMADSAERKEQ